AGNRRKAGRGLRAGPARDLTRVAGGPAWKALRRERGPALSRCSRGQRSHSCAGRRRAPRRSRPVSRAARARLRPGRRARASLRPCAGRGQGAHVTVKLRTLGSADLDDIERIERASYPTPWSRAMFAGELAKPGSLCLGAYRDGTGLVGYLIVSRYV